MSEALWRATAAELAALFRRGEATPTQALDAVLARIEAVNGTLNAIVTLDAPGARAAAEASGRRWRAGTPLGPLDGVPVTVKDNLFVGGLRATWGSLLYAGHIAPRDDLPVERLRAAGAVILGKTNTPELALSGYTDNRVFGATGNPWAPALSPGGSSGGAVAAVASGLGAIAVATDAGGSIRRPSAHAGVAGLKPGIGRVPRRFGFPPLAQDLQVIGPIARSIADLRMAFALMATPAPPCAAKPSLRIGVIGALPGVPIEPAILAAFEAACATLRGLGHGLEEIACPWEQDEVNALFANLACAGVARVMASHEDWRGRVTESIAAQAESGAGRSAVELVRNLDAVAAFRWRMADVMAQWDVLVTPASPAFAWPKHEPAPRMIGGTAVGPRAAAAYSTAVNIAGLPALVVPLPMPAGTLPAGLQIIGPMMGEEALLDLGEAYEAASPWPRLAPL
ncbi:MAG TPA: amidase [Acetobacteraceae bacterium]|nr:amidase [Acetobacteraceae bacterium]